MCSLFWGLDSIITYPAHDYHSFRYIFMNYLSSDNNLFCFLFRPHSWWHSFHCFGGFVEEHCRVWLSVILHRHGTHSVQHAYSHEKAYVGATSLFCNSLGPYMKALTECVVWNCKKQMRPETYLGAWIMPMICEFPQYIGWASQDSQCSGWRCGCAWQMCTLGRHFHVCVVSMSPWTALILHYCSCCVLHTVFSFLFTMVSLLSTMSYLFDPIFHMYSGIFSTAYNNFFSFTLGRWGTDALRPDVQGVEDI